MDIKSREERSKNMAAIRSVDTKPEVFLRKLLFSRGFRYRLHQKNFPGHPDIFLRKYRTAIFVNGCFWHRHPGCRYAYTPKSNVDFWEKKFAANAARDQRQHQELLDSNIRVLTVWECTIKKMMKDQNYCQTVLNRIENFLRDKNEIQLDL